MILDILLVNEVNDLGIGWLICTVKSTKTSPILKEEKKISELGKIKTVGNNLEAGINAHRKSAPSYLNCR